MTVERVLSWTALVFLTGGLVAVSIWKPGVAGFFPPCPVHALTGLYCPGCGATRMLYYLVHGEPWTAFRYNPLAFFCLPYVVAGLLTSALALKLPVPVYVTGWLRRHGYPLGLCLLALVAVFTVARNIPVSPFCELAPGGCQSNP